MPPSKKYSFLQPCQGALLPDMVPGMTPLFLSRRDLIALQRHYRDVSSPSIALPSLLTPEGLERWATVLRLRHPVLPWCHFHTAEGHRGYWVNVHGVLGAIVQPRVVHEEQAPVSLQVFQGMLPRLDSQELQSLSNLEPRPLVETWLDHVGIAYRSWSGKQQQRADAQAEWAPRLSGVSWALLTGKGPAQTLVQEWDLQATGVPPA